MREVPHMERQEVRDVFESWGFQGQRLEEVTDQIISNPKAWLEFMMAHELGLSPVEKAQARRSALLVGVAAIFGSIIPLLPFLVFPADILLGMAASLIVAAVAVVVAGGVGANRALRARLDAEGARRGAERQSGEPSASARRGSAGSLVARAPQHGQCRIPRIAGVLPGAAAQAKARSAPGLDDAVVPAVGAQPRIGPLHPGSAHAAGSGSAFRPGRRCSAGAIPRMFCAWS